MSIASFISRPLLSILMLLTLGVSAQELSKRNWNPDFTRVDTLRAVIHTPYGPMRLRLHHRETPVTVANFVHLATTRFYDGLSFHRVIPGFMAQGGDPLGNGTGGPPWVIRDEFHDSLRHVPGVLSMANRGPGTGGSQFYVVQTSQPHLDGRHTVFGMIEQGWDVSCLILQGDPIDSIRIETVPPGATWSLATPFN